MSSPARFAIVGAGSIGLSLGARLARAGIDVSVIARSAESIDAIRREGIEVHEPESGDRWTARPASTTTLEDADSLDGRTLVVCVRAPDGAELAARLAARVPNAAVACAQNDVDNEEQFARYFDDVCGIVVRQTCIRTEPNRVNALGQGRLVIGAHPDGTSNPSDTSHTARNLATAFETAGFDVAVSQQIAADKWLKLCVNLMSVPNALIHPDEHDRSDFVEIKARIVEEAQRVLAAAGIAAHSCDGGDRSLDQEIRFQRASRERGQSARRLPVYNAVWASLRHGFPLEADLYHERILSLGREHGIEAPMNQRALDLVLRARREGRGPESARCADFLERFRPDGAPGR